MLPISHLKIPNFNENAHMNVKTTMWKGKKRRGKKAGEKESDAIVDGSYKKRQGDQSKGCLWREEELIPEGRTSKWETAQLGAALS